MRNRHLFGACAAALLVGTVVIIPMAGVAGATGPTVGFGPPAPLTISLAGYSSSISCSSRIDCTVVGNGATIEAETNGQWGTPITLSIPIPTLGESFNSVSCSSAGDCTAVGEAEGTTAADGDVGIVATETSGTWGAVTLIPSIGEESPLVSVSCSDALDCTAFGSDGNGDPLAVTETDGTWGAPVELYPEGIPGDGQGELDGVSCVGPGDCTAVGIEGDSTVRFVWTETNGAWGTPTQVSDANDLNAISCIDASDCTAVGTGSTYVTESDGVWGPVTALSGPESDLEGVSCTAVGDCVAVGGGLPSYWIESGGVWGPQETVPEPDGGGGLTSVSCISATICTAVGDEGVNLTYVTSTLVPGGTVALKKSSGLYGNYTESASGSGWGATSDSSVALYECATDYYTPSSCSSTVGPSTPVVASGKKTGTFKDATYRLEVGVIDSDGDTCGLATSGPCYLVAIGNTQSYASSVALGFTAPTASLKESSAVPANYVDKVTAAHFPAGDTIIAQECDSSVDPATNLATDCDSGTAISGRVGSTGKVKFRPTGITMLVGSSFVESGTGTVVAGGTADIVLTDTYNGAVSVVVPITLAS